MSRAKHIRWILPLHLPRNPFLQRSIQSSTLFRLFLGLSFCLFFVALSLRHLKNRPPYSFYASLESKEHERSSDLVKTSSENQRYVKFSMDRSDLASQIQQVLIQHYLSLSSSRTYVFPKLTPPSRPQSTLPLSAILSGVTDEGIDVATFEAVCPKHDVKSLRLSSNDSFASIRAHLESPERCIYLEGDLFSSDLTTDNSFSPSWAGFNEYMLHHFRWSEPVQSTAQNLFSQFNLRSNDSSQDSSYMALQLRSADFKTKCEKFSLENRGYPWPWTSTLTSRSFSPSLDPANASSIIEHCYPDLRRILSTIDLHARARAVRTLYILHRGSPSALLDYHKLAVAIKDTTRVRSIGWSPPMKHVPHSGSISLRSGDIDYLIPAEMEILRHAAVFIGNGYSSITNHVIAMRLGADKGRTFDITLV